MMSVATGARLRDLVAALVVAATSACGTAGTPFGSSGGTSEEIAVLEGVARFIASNYEAAARAGPPAAWCLAVGRRSRLATNPAYRGTDEPWNPEPRLLARLSDVRPPVLPVSACGQDAGQHERLLESDAPAMLMVLTQPYWESHEAVTVEVVMRESPADQHRVLCRLVRGVEGWEVRDCV